MKYKIAAAFLSLLILTACSGPAAAGDTPRPQAAIYLYGERHADQACLDAELALWEGYYGEGLRHLFVELPYYTAAYLNLWMQAEDDGVLETVYNDWEGTAGQDPAVREFYVQIKARCPETVFHGTDVGHQYATTGARYLAYLRGNGQEDTEAYALTEQAIEQGRQYYETLDHAFRENRMAENFIREYEKLGGESVMGIYGSAHTDPDAAAYGAPDVPSMAAQIAELYGEALYTESLAGLCKAELEPLRTEEMEVAGRTYTASYFGSEDISAYFDDYASREFWRLEDAYDDFAACPQAGDVLPYDNYPMVVEPGQVFVVDVHRKDGGTERSYYRSDGGTYQGRPATTGFVPG